jgi:hypothetical protein
VLWRVKVAVLPALSEGGVTAEPVKRKSLYHEEMGFDRCKPFRSESCHAVADRAKAGAGNVRYFV